MLDEYRKFVDGVTSETSKDTDLLIARIKELQEQNVDVARLLTATMGGAGEAGETIDLVKKILFHGKPYTVEIHEKLISECSDQLWYWMTFVIALGENPEYIIRYNIKKLESRYPGGKFSVEKSEVREHELTLQETYKIFGGPADSISMRPKEVIELTEDMIVPNPKTPVRNYKNLWGWW